MTDGRYAEIEIKYAVDGDVPVPDLSSVPGVAAVRPVPATPLEAVYYDTADRRLARARIALRRRRGGHDEGWHVKLPALVGRTEVQGAIDPAAPDEPPAIVRDAVRSRLRNDPLEPIARLETTRAATLLLDGAGEERVEFVDDRVRATDLREQVVRSWREWEAEQVGDDPGASAALLEAADRVLLTTGARHSPSPSKLAQALGGGEAPPEVVEAPETAGEAYRRLVADLVEELHRDEFGLQHGGAEAVHAMRKTIRRLRSLLALTEVGGDEAARLRERLRPVGATLGDARDPVVAADAMRFLDALDEGVPATAEARHRLVEASRAAAEAGRRRAVAAFGSAAHLGLLADLERFAAAQPDGPDAGEEPRRLVALARKAERRAARRAHRSDGSLPALHDARKAAKRARYVVEAVEGAGLSSSNSLHRAARRAEAVHDAAGAHRDVALFVADLPFAAARATADGENAYVYGVLAERGARELKRLQRKVERAMTKLEDALA
jgi:CHAD domain-containing protein